MSNMFDHKRVEMCAGIGRMQPCTNLSSSNDTNGFFGAPRTLIIAESIVNTIPASSEKMAKKPSMKDWT